MWEHDVTRVAHEIRARKVRHVLASLGAILESRHQRLPVHDLPARKVHQMHVRLHLLQGFLVDEMMRHAGDVWHVEGQVVGHLEHLTERVHALQVGGKHQRGFERQGGVVADHFHPERKRGVHHASTDLAQADHGEGLPEDLLASEFALVCLDTLADLGVVIALLRVDHVVDVVVSLEDAAGRQEEGADDELLHRVRVGAGRVEHGDAELGHLVDGDVVGAGTAASDAANRRLHLSDLELVGAQHNRHRVVAQDLNARVHQILALRELLQPYGRDGVEGLDVERRAGVITSGPVRRGLLGRREALLLAIPCRGKRLFQLRDLLVVARHRPEGHAATLHGDNCLGHQDSAVRRSQLGATHRLARASSRHHGHGCRKSHHIV
mmetsp:Transcript_40886/g.68478  ORF Transcript_40886/g.68478 Transcript_40886/m.68478 type:complete len:380 (+) Transcript_40886:756-1895(+)